MPKYRSKRYRAAVVSVDRAKRYPLEEAVAIVKKNAGAKFDETVEVSMRIGVDPKKGDQQVRGSVILPHGLGGRTRTVLVFAEGERAKEALAAGADHVGGPELVDKVAAGWTEFDVAIAVPGMMRYVGKLGKVLGPAGKMPSPKAGTVSDDVTTAVKAYKAGKVEYRVDAGANVAGPVGKASFAPEKLLENVRAFMDSVRAAKPHTSKGTYMRRVVVSSTMGPGVQVDIV
ncbi:MAG: 50S ribosomal protein L1 [Planctomycetes bacterium]|nr:50S ribosomal protein L1 [Planctomycetota bacterium]